MPRITTLDDDSPRVQHIRVVGRGKAATHRTAAEAPRGCAAVVPP